MFSRCSARRLEETFMFRLGFLRDARNLPLSLASGLANHSPAGVVACLGGVLRGSCGTCWDELCSKRLGHFTWCLLPFGKAHRV